MRMYVDVFVAGRGTWYEFKCEETSLVKDIIKEMCIMVNCLEKEDGEIEKTEVNELNLNLICIDSQQVLDNNAKLENCAVQNGNRLMLI